MDEKDLVCGICLDLASDAVETLCCHQLFCEPCLVGVADCPMCRKSLNTNPSIVIRRIIGKMKEPCDFCSAMIERFDMKMHEKSCPERKCSCISLNCQFSGCKSDVLQHLITEHGDDLTNPTFKLVPVTPPNQASNRNLISRKENSRGRLARLGESGKYYCEGPLDTGCTCCDRQCGPDNGCNCTACFQLDLEARRLPRGYFLNRAGFAVRRGEPWMGRRRFYCGRRVMHPSMQYNDGWCGDDDGENCESCRIVDKQLSVGGCYYRFTQYPFVCWSWGFVAFFFKK